MWNIYGRVAFYKRKKTFVAADKKEGVSIIICARNELDALQRNLPAFLEQDYPEFEVILVNDCSEDDSESLLGLMKVQYPKLEVRNIVKDTKFTHGKTMAIGVGIKAAKYEWLLFSDIDCVPINNRWLATMQENFVSTSSVVLGYAGYPKAGKLVRSNLFFSSLHYLGFALRKRPYMADGKNYAYRRKLFFDAKGFDIRATGELQEIIFTGKIANKTNTQVELSHSAIVRSDFTLPMLQWKQHKRVERASFHFYGSKKRHPAFWDEFSIVLFLAAAVALAFHGLIMLLVAASFFVLQQATLAFVLSKACRKLQEKRLVGMLLCYRFIAPLVSFLLSIRRGR